MKSNLFPTFSYVILCLLVCCFFSCTPSDSNEENNQKEENQPAAKRSDLPDLPVTTVDGRNLSIKDVPGKVVLVLFQPECDDCQREAIVIRDNLNTFEDYVLYFISSAPMPQIVAFAEEYQLNTTDKVIFAQTMVQDVINTLGPIPAPSIFIYAEDGSLKKSFKGEVTIEELAAAL